MPKVLEDLVKKLKSKGMPENKAWAIATSTLQKKGVLKKGSHKLNKRK